MTNKQNEQNQTENENQTDVEGFEPTDEAQKLGGGKGTGGGVEIGNFGDDDFNKTDQSIAQASPGKTSNFDNTGGSK